MNSVNKARQVRHSVSASIMSLESIEPFVEQPHRNRLVLIRKDLTSSFDHLGDLVEELRYILGRSSETQGGLQQREEYPARDPSKKTAVRKLVEVVAVIALSVTLGLIMAVPIVDVMR